MKKSFAVFILFIFLASFVLAENNTSTTLPDVKNITGSLNDKTEDILQGNVPVPDWAEGAASLIAGSDNTTWAQLIVGLCVIIIIFLSSMNLLEFTAFETVWVRVIISLGVAIIASIIQATKYLVSSIFFIFDKSVLFGIALILGLFVFLLILRKIITGTKNQGKIDEAAAKGIEIGSTERALRKMNKIVSDAAENKK